MKRVKYDDDLNLKWNNNTNWFGLDFVLIGGSQLGIKGRSVKKCQRKLEKSKISNFTPLCKILFNCINWDKEKKSYSKPNNDFAQTCQLN